MQQLSDVPCVVAQEETPCTPLFEAISWPGYTVFAKIFQASNVSLEDDKPYTVFVPADGTAETLGGESGSFGILGLFSTYGINVTTVESIQSSELFPQISGKSIYIHLVNFPRPSFLHSPSTCIDSTEGTASISYLYAICIVYVH